MSQYKSPYIPRWSGTREGLHQALKSFLTKNYPALKFEEYKTRKGSVGYIASYRQDYTISVFVTLDFDGTLLLDLYWQEDGERQRGLQVKIPVTNQNDYNNGMNFLHGVMPILWDTALDISGWSDQDLAEEIHNALIGCDIHGATVKVDSEEKEEEEEPVKLDYFERAPSEKEILDQIDQALDARDFEKAKKLRAMLKESYSWKHLLPFLKF